MKPVPPIEQYTAIFFLGLWLILVLAAVGFLVAVVASQRIRARCATLTLCLWCVVLGMTISGGMWGWMTRASIFSHERQISELPPDTRVSELQLKEMGMLIFFVKLDGLGRKLLYLTILVPFFLVIRLQRSSKGLTVQKKSKPGDPLDELFGVEGR